MTKNSLPKEYQIILKVLKKDSAFLYHILEGHEGLCFYSTLENPEYSYGPSYRSIRMVADSHLQNQLNHLLSHLKKYIPYEIIHNSSTLPPTNK